MTTRKSILILALILLVALIATRPDIGAYYTEHAEALVQVVAR